MEDGRCLSTRRYIPHYVRLDAVGRSSDRRYAGTLLSHLDYLVDILTKMLTLVMPVGPLPTISRSPRITA